MQRRSFLLAAATAGLTRPSVRRPFTRRLFHLPSLHPASLRPPSSNCSLPRAAPPAPPADALLGRLAGEPGVIALAWHVDYWNGLGWHDPFSSRLATQRPQLAAQLRDEVYTPALVVNGTRMVVGSDAPAIRAAIDAPAIPAFPCRCTAPKMVWSPKPVSPAAPSSPSSRPTIPSATPPSAPARMAGGSRWNTGSSATPPRWAPGTRRASVHPPSLAPRRGAVRYANRGSARDRCGGPASDVTATFGRNFRTTSSDICKR